jgi:hypothetical protein
MPTFHDTAPGVDADDRPFGFARTLYDEAEHAKKAGLLVRCPRCETKNRVPNSATGRLLRCGSCGGRFRIRGSFVPAQMAAYRPSKWFPNDPVGRARATLLLIAGMMAAVVILAALAPADHPTGLDFAPPTHRVVSLAKALANGAPDPCPRSTPVAANEAYGSVYVVCADGVTARP